VKTEVIVESPHCRAIISIQELENLCRDRLEDAKVLYDAGRVDGAFYLLWDM
jgi:hypothetical protein